MSLRIIFYIASFVSLLDFNNEAFSSVSKSEHHGRVSAIVYTDVGGLEGKVIDKKIIEFKGIPYAEPPVGELRWEATRPVKAWDGILNAKKYRNFCPQIQAYGDNLENFNEDCLYLNISTPIKNRKKHLKDQKLPVLVWVHGGAFERGAGELYDLKKIAESGIVAISINYRLGIFGFIANSNFNKDMNGNYGIEDQREALRWIKRNISAFGGDPNNITIAGESAGGGSICMHLASNESSSGLFNKAIIQSAPCLAPLPNFNEQYKTSDAIFKEAGCDSAEDKLSCMKKQPAEKLVRIGDKVLQSATILRYSPVIGGKDNPVSNIQAFSRGEFLKVPTINGSTKQELAYYTYYDSLIDHKKITKENYRNKIAQIYKKNADKVEREYPLDRFESPIQAFSTVISDFNPNVPLSSCLSLASGKTMSRYTDLYQYEFSDDNVPIFIINKWYHIGAVHSSELVYFFDGFTDSNHYINPKMNKESKNLAHNMRTYWYNFIIEDKPFAKGEADWGLFKSNKDVLKLDPEKIKSEDIWKNHKCDFWSEIYPEVFNIGSNR